jgi:hypothetical protein
LITALRTDLSTHWLKNHRETPLRGGPQDDAASFTVLPQWSLLEQLDSRPDWLYVHYDGDGATRQPGPGWVKAADAGLVDRPALWLASTRPTPLWSAADSGAARIVELPVGARMELAASDAIVGLRIHVRIPGDGRQVAPGQGWVDADGVARVRAPRAEQLPWAYPADLAADIRVNAPYRSQLDGSDYASANCGPTTLGMALEAFGINVAPPELRTEVLNAEDFPTYDDDAGSYIWALARVAQQHGLKTVGLYDGESLHRWSIEEVRATVQGGDPVIVQVRYKNLPRREGSAYWGDHYILVTGLVGDRFLYNDPIGDSDEFDGPGWDRLMTSEQLHHAMRASDTPYAFTAFGLSRN